MFAGRIPRSGCVPAHAGPMAKIVERVVVFVQENHTTDHYFSSLRTWGANVATGWPTQPNPPAHDQAHTRAAYAKWLHAQTSGATTPATHLQVDTDAVLPFYAWLAKTGARPGGHPRRLQPGQDELAAAVDRPRP